MKWPYGDIPMSGDLAQARRIAKIFDCITVSAIMPKPSRHAPRYVAGDRDDVAIKARRSSTTMEKQDVHAQEVLASPRRNRSRDCIDRSGASPGRRPGEEPLRPQGEGREPLRCQSVRREGQKGCEPLRAQGKGCKSLRRQKEVISQP